MNTLIPASHNIHKARLLRSLPPFHGSALFHLVGASRMAFFNTGICVQAPNPVLKNAMAKLVSEVIQCRIHIDHGKHDGGKKDADNAGEDDNDHRFHGSH